jgi:hypothetical protein
LFSILLSIFRSALFSLFNKDNNTLDS